MLYSSEMRVGDARKAFFQATGFPANGGYSEAEISAWEVSSGGLGRSWAGWILTLMNLAQGLVINPRGVYGAFMRGRQTRNLFGRDFDERILSNTVGGLRSSLNLNARLRQPRFADHIALIVWALAAIVVYLMAVLLPCLPFLAVFWILFG